MQRTTVKLPDVLDARPHQSQRDVSGRVQHQRDTSDTFIHSLEHFRPDPA